MADIIKVKPNDTVTRILQINRNLNHSELPPWIKKVEKLNPTSAISIASTQGILF